MKWVGGLDKVCPPPDKGGPLVGMRPILDSARRRLCRFRATRVGKFPRVMRKRRTQFIRMDEGLFERVGLNLRP